MPLPLSVAIICKDNERTIGRTLESIADLAAEVVAVDSGSTDRTIAILGSFHIPGRAVRVIRSDWLGHIRTKQKALDACTQAWILCLDSDESVLPDLGASIRSALSTDRPAIAGYRLNRKVFYQGRPLNHAWQPEWRLRLVRRAVARWDGIDPHDALRFSGDAAAARLSGDLRHDSFETFADHLRKQWSHSATMAAGLHTSGRRGSYLSLLVSPPGAFLKQLVLKRSFQDGYAGWLAAASTAAGALMKHAILLELSRSTARTGDPTPHAADSSGS